MNLPPWPRRPGLGKTPTVALDAVICDGISHLEGKPCPTRRDVQDWTGMPRRIIRAYLDGMQQRGILDIETNAAAGHSKRRRMRVLAHDWTAASDWTEWSYRPGNPRIAGLRKATSADRMTD